MRLRLIIELKMQRAISRMMPLLQNMPKSKIKHSKRVAKTLNKAGVNKIGVYAGLLHDYLERGGNIYTLSDHINELGLPPAIVKITTALSSDEKNAENNANEPLVHLQNVLKHIEDEELKNVIILIKLSDRLDNLTKRTKRGSISLKYRLKSLELVDWLRYNYTGDDKPLNQLMSKIVKMLPTAGVDLV